MMWHDWPTSGTKLWNAKIRTEREFVFACKSLVSGLKERERFVLAAYYGLPPFTPHTMEDIGHRLGVTRDRVRQIKNRALGRLQNDLR